LDFREEGFDPNELIEVVKLKQCCSSYVYSICDRPLTWTCNMNGSLYISAVVKANVWCK